MDLPRRLATPARIAAWLGAGAVLALVFLAYLEPQLAQQLAVRVWACF